MQTTGYAWPLSFTLSQLGWPTVQYYAYVVNLGVLRDPTATPYIVPTRVPMMILRDPPGKQVQVQR